MENAKTELIKTQHKMLLESVRKVFDMIDADITFAVDNKIMAYDIGKRFWGDDYRIIEMALRRALVDISDAEKKISETIDKL